MDSRRGERRDGKKGGGSTSLEARRRSEPAGGQTKTSLVIAGEKLQRRGADAA